MKRILFSFILLIIGTFALPQTIYFCNNYTDNGDPIETGNVWTVKSTGGNVYVLYKNGGRTLGVNSITFYIDKLSTSATYTVWENKYLSVNPNKTWAVLDYRFTSAGEYKVSVLINSISVVTQYVTIKMDNSGASTASNSTLYYSGSSVIPGTNIDLTSGYVYSEFGPFYLNSGQSKVFFKVSNGDRVLATNKLYVDITKKNYSGTFDFVETKNYDISDLNWVYFFHVFYSVGTYKVNVYNGKNVWINSATFSVY